MGKDSAITGLDCAVPEWALRLSDCIVRYRALLWGLDCAGSRPSAGALSKQHGTHGDCTAQEQDQRRGSFAQPGRGSAGLGCVVPDWNVRYLTGLCGTRGCCPRWDCIVRYHSGSCDTRMSCTMTDFMVPGEDRKQVNDDSGEVSGIVLKEGGNDGGTLAVTSFFVPGST